MRDDDSTSPFQRRVSVATPVPFLDAARLLFRVGNGDTSFVYEIVVGQGYLGI